MLDYKALLPEEDTYLEFMTDTVEPYLAEIRRDGFFTSRDNIRLYYEYHLPKDPVGAIVISHGFNESAEKFREMAYWFTKAGYAVFALDHRDHGRSARISSDLSLTDIEHFSDYVSDLHCFVRRIVRPVAASLPLYLYGHSMGGAIAILYLQTHTNDFQKAILNAPMLKPITAGIPAPVTRLLSGVLRAFGMGKRIVFTETPGFNENEAFEDSPDTSKPRFEYYRRKRVKYPYLQNSHPTYRWVNESIRIGHLMLDPARCARIKIPVLLFSAGVDTFVYRREQEIFIALVEKGEICYEERARHEIYMSTNDVMADYLAAIEGFIENKNEKGNDNE